MDGVWRMESGRGRETYDCKYVRLHLIRGDLAVIFQEVAGYGIDLCE